MFSFSLENNKAKEPESFNRVGLHLLNPSVAYNLTLLVLPSSAGLVVCFSISLSRHASIMC